MPRSTLVLDGLWYCLCPSFTLHSLNRPGLSIIKKKRGQLPNSARWISTSPQRCQMSKFLGAGRGQAKTTDGSRTSTSNEQTPLGSSQQHDEPNVVQETNSLEEVKRQAGVPHTLEAMSTPDLETKLQDIVVKYPTIPSATQILRTLIRDRHIRPEVRHYRALMLANIDPVRGSPNAVGQLLAEMEGNGVPADSGTLHAALQVLAVHPDYILRQNIVRTLRDRWLPLSPAGWHYVVAGLLKEHQFELAIDHIALMERKDIMIESWLHSLLMYNLCDVEEFDEVLRLMRSRTAQGHDISLDLWSYVLDVASEAGHYETTIYAWKQIVELGYLSPPYEVCSNVLMVASRTGDVDLAASVAQFLSDAGIPLKLADYEKMVEMHLLRGDLLPAFEVLCSMQTSGTAVEESSTRSILTYMIQEKITARDAWEMLKKLRSMKHTIPAGCAKVVLELCEHEALDNPFAVDEGIKFYKELYTLCPDGADVSTYNCLISMCRRAENRPAAMFIVKEMASLGVVPNTPTFEHLILMCLEAGNYQSACMYFEDLLKREPTLGAMSEETEQQIREMCSKSRDRYAIRLQNHPRTRGDLKRTSYGLRPVAPVPIQKVASDAPVHYSRLHRYLEERKNRQIGSLAKRRAQNKERRKKKRRAAAIARNQAEDDWENYEVGGLVPEGGYLKVDSKETV